jgi:hypothetical protein
MSKQIFKYAVPVEPLFGLLDKICIKEENTYIFNNNVDNSVTNNLVNNISSINITSKSSKKTLSTFSHEFRKFFPLLITLFDYMHTKYKSLYVIK